MNRRYPQYHDSGVEWIGQIPTHWEVAQLKAVASINDDALSNNEDPLRSISYVDIGSVDSTAGITHIEEMVFEDAPARARRLVRDGDTIVSTVRTYLRAITAVRTPPPAMVVSTGFAVIRPHKLVSDFASWVLTGHGFVEEVVARSNGVTYPAINAPTIGEIPIPVPPMDDQRAIANFLDSETGKVDALVEQQERLLERLAEYRASLISHTVTKGLPSEAAAAAGLDPYPQLHVTQVWNGLGDDPRALDECALKFEGRYASNSWLDALSNNEIPPSVDRVP